MLIVWIFLNCFFVIFNCLDFLCRPGAQTQQKQGGGPEGWGPKPRKSGGPEGWGPEGWGPEGWGPEGWGPEGCGPNISRFFFPSPATKFVLFFPLWGLLVEFWWCLKRRGAQMCTFGVLWLSCASPGGPEAAGVSHDNQRAQTCTFEGPGVQKHHQNSTRRHPEREEKNEFCGGRGKKKERNFGGPWEGRSRGRGVPRKGGPNQTLKPTPTHETLSETVKLVPTHTDNTQHNTTQHTTHNKSNSFWPKSVWPKSVLAKVGHTTKTLTLAKVGLAKLGRQKGWPKSVWPKLVWPKSAMTTGRRVAMFTHKRFRISLPCGIIQCTQST